LDHAATQFLINLGIKYAGDGTEYEVLQLIGDNNQFMSQSKYDYLGGDNAHYSIDRMNRVGATVLFSSENERTRMFVNEGENYRTIASTIILGAIANGDGLNLKAYLISEMVNFFLGISPVTGMSENILYTLNGGLNYPNPFIESTTIEYMLNETNQVRIAIYDLEGHMIKLVSDSEQKAGKHRVIWDATDNNGRRVATGCYFYRITAGETTVCKKMILTK
jgi:hypothetical protein